MSIWFISRYWMDFRLMSIFIHPTWVIFNDAKQNYPAQDVFIFSWMYLFNNVITYCILQYIHSKSCLTRTWLNWNCLVVKLNYLVVLAKFNNFVRTLSWCHYFPPIQNCKEKERVIERIFFLSALWTDQNLVDMVSIRESSC